MNNLVETLNKEFGLAIFAELLGKVPKHGERVRLFDTTPTSQDTFYRFGKRGFPTLHNFSDGTTYTPITAYAKAYNLSNKDAVKELKEKYLLQSQTTYRLPYKASPLFTAKVPLTIDTTELQSSLQGVQNSNLIAYMSRVFGKEITDKVLACYMVGSSFCHKSNKYDTAFWYQNHEGKPLNAKLLAYDASNGKRVKEIPPNWYHALKGKEMPNIGFFGEHLKAEKIWIVESEKTALYCKAYFLLQDCQDIEVWACGGKERLIKAFENCSQELIRKKFILVPDCHPENKDFAVWQNKGLFASERFGIDVAISTYLQDHTTAEQKKQKFDIADFIVFKFGKPYIILSSKQVGSVYSETRLYKGLQALKSCHE